MGASHQKKHKYCSRRKHHHGTHLCGHITREHRQVSLQAQFYDSLEFEASESFGDEAEKGVKVKLLASNIYGFVGGDIVSGIIYTGMNRSEELSCHIGTNNEMVRNKRLHALLFRSRRTCT